MRSKFKDEHPFGSSSVYAQHDRLADPGWYTFQRSARRKRNAFARSIPTVFLSVLARYIDHHP